MGPIDHKTWRMERSTMMADRVTKNGVNPKLLALWFIAHKFNNFINERLTDPQFNGPIHSVTVNLRTRNYDQESFHACEWFTWVIRWACWKFPIQGYIIRMYGNIFQNKFKSYFSNNYTINYPIKDIICLGSCRLQSYCHVNILQSTTANIWFNNGWDQFFYSNFLACKISLQLQ